MCICIFICILYMYIYKYTHTHIQIYIYLYTLYYFFLFACRKQQCICDVQSFQEPGAGVRTTVSVQENNVGHLPLVYYFEIVKRLHGNNSNTVSCLANNCEGEKKCCLIAVSIPVKLLQYTHCSDRVLVYIVTTFITMLLVFHKSY